MALASGHRIGATGGVMADRQDATLLVQLAQWGTQLGLEEAMLAVAADAFDPDTADASDRLLSRILIFGETIGTLTKNNLLDTELVLDWMWVGGVWQRVAPAVIKERKKLGDPKLYENFEKLAGLDIA
jgi:hypothetical protein